LTDKLITEYKSKIKKLVLIPSDGGRFEVIVNGGLIYSKLESGRFPEYDEIRDQLPS